MPNQLDTQLMRLATRNAAVSGTYYGQPFTGIALRSRQNTMSYREELTIQLDAPITVYGDERSLIIMDAQLIEQHDAREYSVKEK